MATAGPLPLIKAMAKIQGQSTSNPTHIAQIATLAALTGTQEPVEMGPVTIALFDDTCGNLIQIAQQA